MKNVHFFLKSALYFSVIFTLSFVCMSYSGMAQEITKTSKPIQLSNQPLEMSMENEVAEPAPSPATNAEEAEEKVRIVTHIVNNEVVLSVYCTEATYFVAQASILSQADGEVLYRIKGTYDTKKLSFSKLAHVKTGQGFQDIWVDFWWIPETFDPQTRKEYKTAISEFACVCSCSCFKKTMNQKVNLLLAPQAVQIGAQILLNNMD